jgi:hypothetical protein
VPQIQSFSAISQTTTNFSRRLTPDCWISLRLSRRWSLHKVNAHRSKPHLCYNRLLVCQCVLISGTHLEPMVIFLLFPDNCRFIDVGRPIWWGDGSVVYNCCWASPAQSFSGQKSCRTHNHISLSQTGTSLDLEGQVPISIYPRSRVAQLYLRHWIFFSPPLTTCKATVEVFHIPPHGIGPERCQSPRHITTDVQLASRPAGQTVLVSGTHQGHKARFLLMSYSCERMDL